MANFKVGQRVRVIEPRSIHYGKEGSVMGFSTGPFFSNINGGAFMHGPFYRVRIDGYGELTRNGRRLCFPPHSLAPLTDPKADAFIESLKKLAREPQPVAPVDVRQ